MDNMLKDFNNFDKALREYHNSVLEHLGKDDKIFVSNSLVDIVYELNLLFIDLDKVIQKRLLKCNISNILSYKGSIALMQVISNLKNNDGKYKNYISILDGEIENIKRILKSEKDIDSIDLIDIDKRLYSFDFFA